MTIWTYLKLNKLKHYYLVNTPINIIYYKKKKHLIRSDHKKARNCHPNQLW